MVKKQLKSLSFHPRLAAVGDVLFGLILMWWFVALRTWFMVGVWFMVRMLWWVFLARFVYYSKGLRRHLHIFSLFIFHSGMTSWLLFVDRGSWGWNTIACFSVFLSAVSFWLLPTTQNDLSFVGKPQKRFRLTLSVLGIAGVWSGVGALIAFNIFSVPILVWIILATLLTSVTSVVWWKEYGVYDRSLLMVWWGAITVLIFEFAWVIQRWPIHFLSSALCITWLWYVLWLMVRFRLSPDGIQWKKQMLFLTTNTFLFILFLTTIVTWK